MSTAAQEPQIEIGPPKALTTRAVLAISAEGLALVLPVLASILAVTVLKLSAATVLVPLLVLTLATFLLPLGFGNLRVVKLVQSLGPPPASSSNIVQLTLQPRLRTGTRAELEDADDIGYLTVNESAVEFVGDSVKMRLPLTSIRQVRSRNIGFRGLFVYGARICLEVDGLPGITSVEVAERSSRFLNESRRLTQSLFTALAAHVASGASSASSRATVGPA